MTNNEGTLTAQISANPEAGFSMLTYSAASGNTVGHGLNQAPQIYFERKRNTTSAWLVTTNVIDGSMDYLYLSSNAASAAASGAIQQPTSTVLTPNVGSGDVVCYAWHSVPGYSAIGTYVGNGSTDGPFIYTGFRPAWVMYKRTNGAGSWQIYDSTRDIANPCHLELVANSEAAEVDTTTYRANDFLSNGFKLRGDHAGFNESGDTYIYMAFAENPFGGSDVAPATAR